VTHPANLPLRPAGRFAVLIADAEMPPLLAARLYVDFRGVDGPLYDERVRELVRALRGEKPGLLDHPWETLCLPSTPEAPPEDALALQLHVHLYRAVPGDGPAVAWSIPGPLRVLVAIGSPEAQNARGELARHGARARTYPRRRGAGAQEGPGVRPGARARHGDRHPRGPGRRRRPDAVRFAVHRWTAPALAARSDASELGAAHSRAARYWRWQVETVSQALDWFRENGSAASASCSATRASACRNISHFSCSGESR
jgi:hypothetical protein